MAVPRSCWRLVGEPAHDNCNSLTIVGTKIINGPRVRVCDRRCRCFRILSPAGTVNRYLTVRAASYRFLHDRHGGLAAMTAERVLSEEELAALLADTADETWFSPDRRPLPAVLDTDFVRTGLHYQLSNGIPPRSVRTARDGLLRLFMEYDTLTETGERLPKFADQLGVPVPDLRRVRNERHQGLRQRHPRHPLGSQPNHRTAQASASLADCKYAEACLPPAASRSDRSVVPMGPHRQVPVGE